MAKLFQAGLWQTQWKLGDHMRDKQTFHLLQPELFNRSRSTGLFHMKYHLVTGEYMLLPELVHLSATVKDNPTSLSLKIFLTNLQILPVNYIKYENMSL